MNELTQLLASMDALEMRGDDDDDDERTNDNIGLV